MNEDQTIARVLTLLFELGDTPAGVAASLIAKGAKGVPGEECNCPVYNFLAAEDVEIDSVIEYELRVGGVGESVPIPQAVTDFIKAFDRNDNPWPELVAEVES